MCECCIQVGSSTTEESKHYRLADFFTQHWENYLSEGDLKVSKAQFKAVNAMQECRTAALGVDQYVCPDCGEIKEVYRNCRNRFCPTCSWGDTVKWAAHLQGQLMSVPHRHVVFTLPHDFIPLIKRNGKYLLNVFLRTAADTFKDWVEHKYRLKIGVVSVLHTFGETKEYHPHIHMLVSWGGIDKSGNKQAIKGDYVNFDFIRSKFQNKFEGELIRMYDTGELRHDFIDRVSMLRYLKRINKNRWALHLEPPMPAPSAVIRYIGRYSKRACLSEYKITEMEGEYISFRCKDYKNIGADNRPTEKIVRLHYREFFPRLLQHVPLPYFRLVRYYGLYSTKSTIPEAFINKEEEAEEEREWENPFECRYCKKERIRLYTIYDLRKREEREEKFDKRLHPYYVLKRAG